MRTDRTPPPFYPGVDLVPVSGCVSDWREERNLVEVATGDFHPAAGVFHNRLEIALARYHDVRQALLTNSGSSANLLAVSALRSPLLGEKRLAAGDEVITVACGFPTTVAPIVQCGLVPVFVDVGFDGNVDPSLLEAAWTPRTRAVVLAHALGNPFDLRAVVEFCSTHRLFLVEDCCDALGSTYRGNLCGTFGHLATLSFYPAHHMTTGEGGCVLTRDPLFAKIVASLRDWGRDCHCPSGRDNTCGRRFDQEIEGMPAGYDHKYTYRHLGYNLRMSEMQAAVGCAQFDKLDAFHAARRENWAFYSDALENLHGSLRLPVQTPGSDPSPFGFLLVVKATSILDRNALVRRLEARKIQTRMLFAGNLTRHPALVGVRYLIPGELGVSDYLMNRAFWIGVFPGVTPKMREWVVRSLREELRP